LNLTLIFTIVNTSKLVQEKKEGHYEVKQHCQLTYLGAIF